MIIGAVALSRRWVRIPSDRLLVVYGKVRGERCAVVFDRGRKFVWPVFQDYAYLSTVPFPVSLPDRRVMMVAISRDPAVRKEAAERLLGLHHYEILQMAEQIIHGCIDEGRDVDAKIAKVGLVRCASDPAPGDRV